MSHHRKTSLENPTLTVDANPVHSYNPDFENHMIADQNITTSGYIAHIYDDLEYRRYVYKNASNQVIKIDPWILYEAPTP